MQYTLYKRDFILVSNEMLWCIAGEAKSANRINEQMKIRTRRS